MAEAIENDDLSPVDDIDFLTDWLSAPENIATGGEPYSAVRQRYNEVAMMDENNPLPAWTIPTDIQQINPTEGMGFFGKMRESLTGTARETGATESAFNYTDMPEVVEGLGATDAAGGVGKSVFGNAMIAQAAPEEMAAIISAQYPDVEVTQDIKGNFLLKSGVDGKTYAIKPGFEFEDAQRLATQALITVPAAVATGAVATATAGITIPALVGLGVYGLTSYGYQKIQESMGGELNEADVLIDAITPPGMDIAAKAAGPVLGKIVSNVIQPARDAFSRTFNKYNPPANTVTVPALSDVQLGDLFREAADGSVDAQLRLADYSQPNEAVIGAAEQLGIGDFLQPDHVSTSVEFIQVLQTLKGIRGIGATAGEEDALKEVVERATQAVLDLGAEADKNVFSNQVLTNATDQLTNIKEGADELWTKFRTAIGDENGFIEVGSGANKRMEPNLAVTEYNPDSLLTNLEAKLARENGITTQIDPFELRFINTFKPKEEMREIPQFYKKGENKGQPIYDSKGKQKVKLEPTGGLVLPNLQMLETFRRDLTSAMQSPHLFPNSNERLLSDLYGNVLEEERTLLDAAFSLNRDDSFKTSSILENFDMARATSRLGFGMQDDLQSIFGKKLDKYFAPIVRTKMGILRGGDAKGFNEFLQAIPAEDRQYTLLNGLNMFLGKQNKEGKLTFTSYADWWDGLRSQGESFKLVKDTLTEDQFQTFENIYLVSRSISNALKEKPVGGATLQKEAIAAIRAEKLTKAIVEGAKTLGKGAVLEGVVQSAGGPPAMGALAQAVRTGTRQAAARNPTAEDAGPRIKAAIDLIVSDDFAAMIRGRYSPESVRRWANSPKGIIFGKVVGLTKEATVKILEQYVKAATSEIITEAVTENSAVPVDEQASVSAKMLNDIAPSEGLLPAPPGNAMTASQQMLRRLPPVAVATRGVPGLGEPANDVAATPAMAPPPSAVAQGPSESSEMMARLFPMDMV